MIKPGYRTSEFWFTMVSFIFSGLYLTGILTENEHKEQLIEVVSHAVESVILISGQVWILARYIRGRTEVKKIVQQRKDNDDSERTSKTTSRKNKPRANSVSTKSKKRSTK